MLVWSYYLMSVMFPDRRSNRDREPTITEALLTKISILPKARTVSSMTRLQPCSSLMSWGKRRHCRPLAMIRALVFSASTCSSGRYTMATFSHQLVYSLPSGILQGKKTYIGTFHGKHDGGSSSDTGITTSDDCLFIEELNASYQHHHHHHSGAVWIGRPRTATYLASRLVVIKVIVTFLDGSCFWLSLHIGLNTNDTVDLGFNWEITRFGEFSRSSSRSGWLIGCQPDFHRSSRGSGSALNEQTRRDKVEGKGRRHGHTAAELVTPGSWASPLPVTLSARFLTASMLFEFIRLELRSR